MLLGGGKQVSFGKLLRSNLCGILLYSVKLVACETGFEKAWFGMEDLVDI